MKNRRIITIRPRVKLTAAGEARPTQVAIFENGQLTKRLDLTTTDDELKFVACKLVLKHCKASATTDLHHYEQDELKYRPIKAGEDTSKLPQNLIKEFDGKLCLVTHVPAAYVGLSMDDTVLMAMGGCGDDLAYAIVNRSETDKVAITVKRCSPNSLKQQRPDDNKDDDVIHLFELYQAKPSVFHSVRSQDLAVLSLRATYALFEDTMKQRIACEQRLLKIFEREQYLTGSAHQKTDVDVMFAKAKADNATLQALIQEEKRRERELAALLERIPVYKQVFTKYSGVGTRIAARIITAIVDIRRFRVWPDEDEMTRLNRLCKEIEDEYYEPIKNQLATLSGQPLFDRLDLAIAYYREKGTDAACNKLRESKTYHQQRSNLRRKALRDTQSKVKAFIGVHLVFDENEEKFVFPRRRRGKICNWSTESRQAMYLLGDQFVKRRDTEWGEKLRLNKTRQREYHPEVVLEGGKKRFTDGHIHKRAIWRTLSQFAADVICKEWLELEEGTSA